MKNDIINTDGIKRTSINRPRPIGSLVGDKSRTEIRETPKRTIKKMDISRSQRISHFESNIKITTPKPVNRNFDIAPVKHPITKPIENRSANNYPNQNTIQTTNSQSLKEIKENAIAEATAKMENNDKPAKLNKTKSKLSKIILIALVVLITVSYLIYINLPTISINVASAQAGIDVSHPEYLPDGYKPAESVEYANGQVTINYISTNSKNTFSIKQEKSSWDSTAVKSMVEKESNGEFITTENAGLTIFTYGNNASWVNGGILYKISGNAELDCHQIRRIANSL